MLSLQVHNLELKHAVHKKTDYCKDAGETYGGGNYATMTCLKSVYTVTACSQFALPLLVLHAGRKQIYIILETLCAFVLTI